MNIQKIKFKKLKKLVTNIVVGMEASDWRPDYVVGVTRGGLLPATMISHYFNIPMHSLDVSLSNPNYESEHNCWMSEDAAAGKNILIVDDINDQGSTINWIIDDWSNAEYDPKAAEWFDRVWNKNVRFAVVVDNLSSKSKVKMDYWGMEINKAIDPSWIQFPYEEWWR
jgi:hypoxanthine phosphoribosyltransferase